MMQTDLGSTTVFVSLGNSDDRLKQRQWADFVSRAEVLVRLHTSVVHGVWFSAPASRWQNACICFEISPDRAAALASDLVNLRQSMRQDSIAWTEAATTRFI